MTVAWQLTAKLLIVAWIYTHVLTRIFSYSPPSPHGFILYSLYSIHRYEYTEDLKECSLQWEHQNKATFTSDKIKICEVWGHICDEASFGKWFLVFQNNEVPSSSMFIEFKMLITIPATQCQFQNTSFLRIKVVSLTLQKRCILSR